MIKERHIIISLTKLNFKQVWSETPFIILVVCGMAFFSALTLLAKGTYHSDTLPATYKILETLRSFDIGILMVLALYTSEGFWKEKSSNIQLIVDSLPISIGAKLLGQVFGMALVLVSLLGLFMVTGIVIQISTGFYALNIQLYLSTLSSEFFINGLLVILLTLFINSLVNQKFIANAIVVLIITSINYFPAWGLEHKLWHYARLSLGKYSDLNGYQAYELKGFFYYTIYWLGLGVLLFQITRLIKVRGIEIDIRQRLIIAKERFSKSIISFMLLGTVLFISSGSVIYINTYQINPFESRKKRELHKVAYENQLKGFESYGTPEIIGMELDVDFYSSDKSYEIFGSYTMVNSTAKPISTIQILAKENPKITLKDISFNKAYALAKSFPEFKFNTYNLNNPILPGDTLKMDFKIDYTSVGFAQKESFSVVKEGAFLTEMDLPKLSYNAVFELESSLLRRKYDLKPKIRSREIGDPAGYQVGTSHAKNISFDVTISTDLDQEGATSGYLIKKWSEDNRNYFHYQSEMPIENQFAILSGKFENRLDQVITNQDTVQLRIAHHKSHEYNVTDMMNSMKATIIYSSKNISPYQYKTLNLFEIPRYHDFAMSIPNTIPFSEDMGFMLSKNEDFNVPFYITAHEVAHQWWGDQVRGALVKGSEVIEETLSQYMAAVVYIEEFGTENLKHIMDFEKRRYMTGRKRETNQENALFSAENQSYIHYGKGLINMMAMRHYISEDSVNSALRSMIEHYPARQGIYADSKHLIKELRQVTADSLQYLVTDLFEKIIFYENSIKNALVTQGDSSKYKLTVDITATKFEANAEGFLKETNLNDWIEVGVFGKGNNGKEKLIHRKMYQFRDTESQIIIELEELPYRVVIDPDNLLMDRNTEDNEWKF